MAAECIFPADLQGGDLAGHHLMISDDGGGKLHLVKLVVGGGGTRMEKRRKRRRLTNEETTKSTTATAAADAAKSASVASTDTDDSSSLSSGGIDSTCTICGQHYVDRVSFNAHIKAHLKEKLNIRREQRKEEEERERQKEETESSSSPSPRKRKCNKDAAAAAVPTDVASATQQPRLILKSHSELMAELGACKPIPPAAVQPVIVQHELQSLQPLLLPLENICTPEISDMEEDLMSYEMEMNRIDFHNDLSSILDQIEKDFESPGGISSLQDVALETPPDSDSENNNNSSDYLGSLLLNYSHSPVILPNQPQTLQQQQQQEEVFLTNSRVISSDDHLLGLDKFTRLINLHFLPSSPADNATTSNMSQEATTTKARGGGGSLVVARNNRLVVDDTVFLGERAELAKKIQITAQESHEAARGTDAAAAAAAFSMQDQIFSFPIPKRTLSNAEAAAAAAAAAAARANASGGEKCRPFSQQQQQQQQHNSRERNAATTTTTGHQVAKLVQSPDSLAKVGLLPPQALALLSRLPAKLFLPESSSPSSQSSVVDGVGARSAAAAAAFGADSTRLVNVVKVERSNILDGVSASAANRANLGPQYTVINIECHQRGENGQVSGRRLIETYRAIDTGTEIKLLLGNGDPNSHAFQNAPMKSSPIVAASNQQPCSGGEPPKYYCRVDENEPNVLPSPMPPSKPNSECGTCGKMITTKNMARHVEKHAAAAAATITTASSASSFTASILGTDKSFPCRLCEASFPLKSLLKVHAASHKTSKGPFRCTDCTEVFPLKADLARHRRLHGKARATTCHGCGTAFAWRWELSEHLRSEGGCQGGGGGCSPPEKLHFCRVCNKSFAQKGHLNRHEKTHGSVEDLRCRVCSKICKNNLALIRHRSRHLACTHCSCTFENKVSLQDHLLRSHKASAIITVEKGGGARKGDSFMVGDLDDDSCGEMSPDSSVATPSTGIGGGGAGASNSVDEHLSPDAVGESLADISNSNFFNFTQELNDEFYSTDLF